MLAKPACRRRSAPHIFSHYSQQPYFIQSFVFLSHSFASFVYSVFLFLILVLLLFVVFHYSGNDIPTYLSTLPTYVHQCSFISFLSVKKFYPSIVEVELTVKAMEIPSAVEILLDALLDVVVIFSPCRFAYLIIFTFRRFRFLIFQSVKF